MAKASPPINNTPFATAARRALVLAAVLMVAACGSNDDPPDRPPPEPNAAPEADAGDAQTVNVGDTVSLDGSDSSDAEGAVTYSWTLTPARDDVTLSSTTAAEPTFTAPGVTANVDLVFTLTVTDTGGATDTANVTVTVNAPPTANAGDDQVVDPGAVVTLAGSGSDPGDGDIEYSWQLTDGSGVNLSNREIAGPIFTAPAATEDTTYTFTLTVTDEHDAEDTDEVTISINVVQPTADAGNKQNVASGASTTLDGSGSVDAVRYAWRQVSGPDVTLDDDDIASPTFDAPTVTTQTTLVFELEVTDALGATHTSRVEVVVAASGTSPVTPGSGPQGLTVDAGADRPSHPGETVNLNGSVRNPDRRTLTYTWTGPAGITLTGADTAMATFTVPGNSADGTTYTFTFTVTGGGDTATDTVTITISTGAVANAGQDKTVTAGLGDTIPLNGTNSSVPGGQAPTYAWTAPAGITLTGGDTATPSFAAPRSAGDLVFTLTVSAPGIGSATDTVTITINPKPIAKAGGDQNVGPGGSVTLDGGSSEDPGGGRLEYDWAWMAPPGVSIEPSADDVARISFTVPEATEDISIVFTLTVTEPDGATDTATVTVNVRAVLIAEAGPDKAYHPGQTVTLDGSGSINPFDSRPRYVWTGPSHVTLTLSFSVDDDCIDSNDVLDSRVDDRFPDHVLPGHHNINPFSDKNIKILTDEDGNQRRDSNGNLISGDVPTCDVGKSRIDPAAEATFVAPGVTQDTALVFTLTVSANSEGTLQTSEPDTVTITIRPGPNADILGGDRTVDVDAGAPVILNGSDSSVPAGQTPTYAWTGPSGITLTGADTAEATFAAPDSSGPLMFTLTVSTEDAGSDTTTATITINLKPNADAGADMTVSEGQPVTLDGRTSEDPDGTRLVYAWTIADGEIMLQCTDTAAATFVAPAVTEDTTYTFQLQVRETDRATANDTDTVAITVRPATAFFQSGSLVTLPGPDGTVGAGATYSWAQAAGDALQVALSNTSAERPSFVAPVVIKDVRLTFTRTVTDGGQESTQTVPVTLRKARVPGYRGVSINEAGDRAASAGMDGTVRLWNVADGTEIRFPAETGTGTRSLGQHDGAVYAVAISADGTRVISGGADGVLRLWNTDGTEVRYTRGGVAGSLSDRAADADSPWVRAWIYAVAINEDGTRAASGGFDGMVRLWNTADSGTGTGAEITTFGGETRSLGRHEITDDKGTPETDDDTTEATSVYALAMNDAGTRVLSGGADGTLRLWNADSTDTDATTGYGKALLTLTDDGEADTDDDNMGPVYGVALSVDGTRAASGSADNKVRVWNVDVDDGTGRGTVVKTFIGTRDDVASVALNEAKTRVLSAGGDGRVRLWNADAQAATLSQEDSTIVRPHTDYAWSVALSRDGTIALSAGADGTLNVWETDDGDHTDENTSEPFSTREADHPPSLLGDVHRYALDTRHAIGITDGAGPGDINSVALNADGSRAAAGTGRNTSNNSTDRSMRLWDTATREVLSVKPGRLRSLNSQNRDSGHQMPVNAVAFSADGRLALSGTNKLGAELTPKIVFLWDSISNSDADRIDRVPLLEMAGHSRDVLSVALSADGHLALSGDAGGSMSVWDTTNGRRLRTLDNRSAARGVALSADGQFALSGGHERIHFWNTATGDRLRELRGHDNNIDDVALSANGRLALSGHRDDTVRFWDTSTGELLNTLSGHTDDVKGVALSADGNVALSGGSDKTVRLWDTKSGQVIRSWNNPQQDDRGINSVALSADGHTAMSGSSGAAMLWHLGRSRVAVAPFVDADAGNAQVVESSTVVTLNGLGSTDLQGDRPLTYRWRQIEGPGVALSATDKFVVTFLAPAVAEDTELKFALTVVDANGLVDTDEVSITIGGRLAAHAGADQNVASGAIVTLAGSGADPDHAEANRAALRYAWSQGSGTTVSLSDATEDAPGEVTFTAPTVAETTLRGGAAAETLVFTLTVTDADGTTATDEVSVYVGKADLFERRDHNNTTVRSVSMSRDGNLAVSGGLDGTVRLWNANTGTRLLELGSHDGPVFATAINADGTRAISGGFDGTLRLWTWTIEADGTASTPVETPFPGTGSKGVWIYALSLSKDGNIAASGGFDGKVRLWRTDPSKTAEFGTEFPFNSESLGLHTTSDDGGTPDTPGDDIDVPTSVYAVAVNDDGSRVLSGGADGSVRLWDTSTGDAVDTTFADDDPMGTVFAVAFSGNGEVVAAGTADDNVHVWDAATGTELYELVGHSHDVTGVALNRDGSRVLSTSGDGSMRLWNIAASDAADADEEPTDGIEIATLRRNRGYVWSVALSGDAAIAASAGEIHGGNNIFFWDTATRHEPITGAFDSVEPNLSVDEPGDVTSQQLDGHTSDVTNVALSANGHRALSSDDTKKLLWGVGADSPSHTSTAFARGGSRGEALNADGSRVLSGKTGNDLELWHGRNFTTEACSVVGDEGSAQYRTTFLTGNSYRSITTGHTAAVNAVALSASGHLALSGSEDNSAILWHVDGWKNGQNSTARRAATLTHGSNSINGVALDATGGHALTGGDGGSNNLLFWDVTIESDPIATLESQPTGSATSTALNGHTQNVNDVALDLDGSHAVSGGDDDLVFFWDTASPGSPTTLSAHTDNVQSVALTRDARIALSGGLDDTVILWDTRAGTPLRIMRNHASDVNSVALSASGRVAISGSSGSANNVRLWQFGRTRDPFGRNSTARAVMANASRDATRISISGVGSTGNPLAYYWWQIYGTPRAEIRDNTAQRATFGPIAAKTGGEICFVLTVTDQRGLINTTNRARFVLIVSGGGSAPPALTEAAPRGGLGIASNTHPAAHPPSDVGAVPYQNPDAPADETSGPRATCASTVDRNGRTVHGQAYREHCVYGANFSSADNPLGADTAIRALPNGGVHIFTESLIVGDGSDGGPTLAIEAGASLAFEGASSTLVVRQDARLLAIGTAAKPITLTASSQQNGLTINGGDAHRLEYVVVKHAAPAPAGSLSAGGIELRDVGSGSTIRNLQVYATHGGLALVGGTVDIENFVAVYARGNAIEIGSGWSGSLTNALVIQPERGGDHCLNTANAASGRIGGLTCITSPGTETANLGAGIRLGAGSTTAIERSMVIGTFRDDVDARSNYCLHVDGRSQGGPALGGNIFACEDKTGGDAVLAAWITGSNNQFADVEAPTDPTAATDTQLQLLGGTPPVYSLDYDELRINGTDTTVTAPNGADFPGAASESAAPNWLRPGGIDWTHGIFEGSRDQPLWFEPAR